MKVFHFDLDKWQCNSFFTPVRTKVDIINLWMLSIKTILSHGKLDDKNIHGSLFLAKQTMNRLFFVSENKCFSINFPFNFHCHDGIFSFSTYTTIEIDSKESSDIVSLIQSKEIIEHSDIYIFFDRMSDYIELNAEIWSLLRYLMMQEDGYIRHDHDPKNANDVIHPVNHIDVCYSNSATFKIGIDDEPHFDILKDILDCETSCHFLKKISASH